MRTILRTRDLRAQGHDRDGIRRRVESGSLRRIRRGHYATPDADPAAAAAVQLGCTLTCAAALRRHGAWVVERHVHLRAGRDLAPRDGVSGRVHRVAGRSRDGVDDLRTALSVAARCLPAESLVAAADSILHARLLSPSATRRALSATARGRRAADLADSRAESGLESIARLRLRALRIASRPQVAIDGVGFVDLLVGRRLVIELDGDRWHSTREQRELDRRRDNRLRRLGYIVLRYGYDRVMHDWDAVLDDILSFVRRGAHLRPPTGAR